MIKLADPLVKVTVSLAKNILAPLEITAAASAIDAGIKKKKTSLRDNNVNNLKRKNEWHKGNYWNSWRF